MLLYCLEKEVKSNKAEEAYEKAYKKAKDSLVSTHPIRLGLALNFSVFYYEIADKPDDACSLARKVGNRVLDSPSSLEG